MSGPRVPRHTGTSETYQISVMLGAGHYTALKGLSRDLGLTMKDVIKLMIEEGTRNVGALQAVVVSKADQDS